jgi:hypothetical protein
VLTEFVRAEYLSANVRTFLDLANRRFRGAGDPVIDKMRNPVSGDAYQLA